MKSGVTGMGCQWGCMGGASAHEVCVGACAYSYMHCTVSKLGTDNCGLCCTRGSWLDRTSPCAEPSPARAGRTGRWVIPFMQ